MSTRAPANPQHEGQQQTGGGQQQAGPPTNEQMIQFLMVAKGLNRETAGQEVAADPDSIKQVYQKVKQLMQSGG